MEQAAIRYDGLPVRFHRVRLISRQLQRHQHYVTPLKLVNMGLVNLQRLFKTERVIGRPYEAVIEATNICNTNCQLCPTGLGHFSRPKGVMPWEQYARLIDNWSRWLYRLTLSLWGDPLISPNIFRMIDYAHRAGIWTCLSTNLHAFHPERGDDAALVESGLDFMVCSLHAASQETYATYQPGKQFSAAVSRIESLIATKHRLGSDTPKICLNFVVTRVNEHEIPDFLDLGRRLGCEARISQPSLNLRFLHGFTSAQARDRTVADRIARWLPTKPEYVIEPYRLLRDGQAGLDDFSRTSNGRKTFPCASPWKSIVVNWDGRAAPCSSREPDEDFADTATEPLGRIWNGPKYRAARRSFTHPTDLDVACARCPGLLL